jgi:hypothetical protein
MIKNRTFSPFLYGGALLGIVLTCGLYMDLIADAEHSAQNHLEDAPSHGMIRLMRTADADRNSEEWVAELTSLRPAKVLSEIPNLCGTRTRAANAAADLAGKQRLAAKNNCAPSLSREILQLDAPIVTVPSE